VSIHLDIDSRFRQAGENEFHELLRCTCENANEHFRLGVRTGVPARHRCYNRTGFSELDYFSDQRRPDGNLGPLMAYGRGVFAPWGPGRGELW